MNNIDKKYLFDILTCIGNIESYIGTPKVFDRYARDPMLQDAIERNLEIIGEAVNQMLKLNPEIEISNARRMVDARNKIIHGYGEIEPEQIWSIIIKHLPVLKEEVQILLSE
ncbi:MAG: HepT-like ribonuclease domain-containing protein [Bacteroidales bacterium]